MAFLGGNKRLRTGFRPGPLDVSLYRICTCCIAKNLDIHGLNRDGYKKPPKTHLRHSLIFPLYRRPSSGITGAAVLHTPRGPERALALEFVAAGILLTWIGSYSGSSRGSRLKILNELWSTTDGASSRARMISASDRAQVVSGWWITTDGASSRAASFVMDIGITGCK